MMTPPAFSILDLVSSLAVYFRVEFLALCLEDQDEGLAPFDIFHHLNGWPLTLTCEPTKFSADTEKVLVYSDSGDPVMTPSPLTKNAVWLVPERATSTSPGVEPPAGLRLDSNWITFAADPLDNTTAMLSENYRVKGGPPRERTWTLERGARSRD